jgi:lysophospholipase L1-like esterase
MQFGHNDEAKEPQYKDRYTSVPDYKTNLQRFITETRLHKANPILVTPVTRMRFDKQGNVMETHKEYSAAVWEVGTANNTPVIDLDSMSRKLLQQFGQENSKLLFMYVDSLQNPHYPNGRKDWTHFNEYGARRMAELVLFEITKQKLPLADKISKKTIL